MKHYVLHLAYVTSSKFASRGLSRGLWRILFLFNRQRGDFIICFLQSKALCFVTSLTVINTSFPLNHHLQNKAKTFLRFFPPVISVRFATNHHSTNKAKHFFASFSPVSAFDFYRTIIVRTKQHISLVSPVHNHFTNKSNTFLWFLSSVISVRLSSNLIHFFTFFRP